jgi:hypothetical protein
MDLFRVILAFIISAAMILLVVFIANHSRYRSYFFNDPAIAGNI